MAQRLFFVALALAAASPAAGQGGECVPGDTAATPDLARLKEAELRRVAESLSDSRMAAVAELRRRYPSVAVRAFTMNLEAREANYAQDARRAYELYSRVRAEFAGNQDPAIELEVARAIAGQANALDLQEALDGAAEPLGPIVPGSIDEDSTIYRLKRELVQMFGDRRGPRIRAVVGWERYNLLQTARLNRNDPYDSAPFLALAAEYSDSDHPDLASLVGAILFDVAMSEPNPRRRLAHIEAYVRRFARPPDDIVREHVYDLYSWKAGIEEELGNAAAAARTRREAEAWAERTPRSYEVAGRCASPD